MLVLSVSMRPEVSKATTPEVLMAVISQEAKADISVNKSKAIQTIRMIGNVAIKDDLGRLDTYL